MSEVAQAQMTREAEHSRLVDSLRRQNAQLQEQLKGAYNELERATEVAHYHEERF